MRKVTAVQDITRFDTVGQRFLSYLRELERLAMELPTHLEVLADKPDDLALKYVRDRIQERLDAIRRAASVEE